MLVLTIKAGACVHIGEDIRVYNNEPFAVSIGFEAPKDVRILREEIKDR